MPINDTQLAQLEQHIEQLPPVPKTEYCAKEVIFKIAPKLDCLLQQRNYSYAQIQQELAQVGVVVELSTLKQYLRSARAKSGKRKTRSPKASDRPSPATPTPAPAIPATIPTPQTPSSVAIASNPANSAAIDPASSEPPAIANSSPTSTAIASTPTSKPAASALAPYITRPAALQPSEDEEEEDEDGNLPLYKKDGTPYLPPAHKI